MTELQSKLEKEKALAALYIVVKGEVPTLGFRYTNSGSAILIIKKKDSQVLKGVKGFRLFPIKNRDMILHMIQSGELDNGKSLLLLATSDVET